MKITPFLIVFGILELIQLILALNFIFINNNGGMALGGVIALIGFIIVGIVLGLEQLILKSIKFNPKPVWIIETIIILLLGLYLYTNGLSIG